LAMTDYGRPKLNFGINPLFVAAGMMALGVPSSLGQAGGPQSQASAQTAAAETRLPVFAVASVRQNESPASPFKLAFTSDGVTIENVSLLSIIRAAYGMFNTLDDKFIGVPGWANNENFDIEAKVGDADVAEFQKLNFDKRQLMVQALLADRFKLRAHHETRELPIYELVIAKNGLKLQASDANPVPGDITIGRGRITGQNVVMYRLETALTHALGRTIVDKTGLRGPYDFTLNWTPDDADTSSSQSSNGAVQEADTSGVSIFTAIQEQLGLKLVPAKGPVEVLVVDHVEYPSTN
jgi:uncharacterized protein (TIGR03435 family)